jgi:hypothetical protein
VGTGGEDAVAEHTTAELLQDRLTENGLVRVLSRQDVSPNIVKELPLEEAARLIQQSFAPSPRGSTKKAKKAVKAKKAKKVKKAKRAKKSAKKSAKKKNGGPVRQKPSSQPRYWLRVKRELHILLCTNDKKYASIRRHLGSEGKATQAFITSSITTAVVPFAGASATIIGPLVTIGLIALLRVGTNAWCAGQIELGTS